MNRIKIKTVGKWSIYLQGVNDYYPKSLCIEENYNCYYMNSNKAWDNFYPIPKTVINYCEGIGHKKLLKHIELIEKLENTYVKVYNDNEEVFRGYLVDFLEEQEEEDKQEIYSDCLPLINKEKNSITFINFHSGIWEIQII